MFKPTEAPKNQARHHNMSSKGSREPKAIHIEEEVKIAVKLALDRFCYSNEKELEFPSSFSSTERAFVHRLAQSLGYSSRSKGKGSSRFLTVRKKETSDKLQPSICLDLSSSSAYFIRSLLQRFPPSKKERVDLHPNAKSGNPLATESNGSFDRTRASGRLNNGIPMVPKKRTPSVLDAFRRSLPVTEHQDEIVQLIRDHRVVLVLGETGSGKTTQIPQFLLDDCSRYGKPCRIFCTQPRRLATIAVAERVAAERGESVGQTVGYHIRLESRVSPKTLLTFCTSGVLLRTLMAGDGSLTTVTHVIVDEVHERDGLTDFLLTKLRDVLLKVPTLKLILSSAALDIDLFLQYFGSCPVIRLRGKQFEVKQFFLEDILKQTGFSRQNASKYQEEMQRKETQQKRLNEWFEAAGSGAVGASLTHTFPPGLLDAGGCGDREKESIQQSEKDPEQLKPWLLKEMDSCISSIFLHEDQDAFSQLFNLILHERVSVDYTHSETGSTPLMASAARGFLPEMQQLLSMGADINMRACNGWTALDFAEHFQQTDAVDLLKTSIPLRQAEDREESTLIHCSPTELSSEAQELLRQYHHSFDDQQVDLDLIMTLLLNICTNTNEGAVLIFLPGYDEIVTLRDRIFSDDRMSTQSESYQVFTLHSDMQTLDQKRAMKPTPCGVRKIILSTNIAETSITIDDVVFVIDSGKVKEKSFDTLSRVSMLKSVWICKASVLQRKGRAGRCRPGICFHLFSRFHYKNMQEFQVPQLLRMPLQELCLQTKLLAPSSCPIADFLSKAPQPPPTHSIQSAVQMLKTIDALDQNEDLTDLGFHLADLPVESHLGKMVLCGVVLKCLDPILTIACSLAYRDPFTLPAESSQKRAALQSRMHFTASTFSDHMALLRAFQGWQKARSEGWNRSFCEKNFLSQSTMDMILGMRTQLLGQLRAIGFVRARGDSDIRDVNLNSENWAVVKAALVAGIYPNIVHVNRKASLLCSHREKKVLCHPTSVLSKLQLKENSSRLTQSLPTDWLIYDEMSRGHRVASVRCCSVVTAVTVAVFAGGTRPVTSTLYEPAGQKRNAADHLLNELSDSEPEDLAQMKIDDWLVFQLERENAALLCDLRQKWQELFIKRIRCPSKPWSQQDEAVIQTLVSVLGAEEHEAGLQQPAGVGQRPRPMSSEDGPRSSMRNSRTSPQAPAHSTNDRSKQLLFSDQMKTHSSDGVSKDRPPSSSTSSHSANPDGSDPMGPSSSGKPAPKPGLSSVRYFIMKSNSMRNVEISQEKGIWSTTPSNESKLSQAFLANSLVLLVFSVQGSGHFQGYARMTSVVSQDSCQDWGLTGLGGLFSVEWIRKESLPFSRTQHILNPWNDNKRVQVSRDGQELEPQAGGQLLQLWEWTSGNH